MTRSNGSGFPPNGWPAGFPQPDPSQPYQGQYPTPQQPGYPAQPQYPQQAPQPQQPVTTGRPVRIQNAQQPPQVTQGRPAQRAAPAYAPPQPQPGYGATQSPYQQDPYAVPQSYPDPAPYGLPQASQQIQSYSQPQQAPQRYAAPASQVTQPPAYQVAPARPALSYEPAAVPTARPTAPPARQPEAYGNPSYQQAPPQSPYVPAQQAPQPYNSWQGGPAPSIDPQGYDLGAYMPAPDPRTGRPTAPPVWNAPAPPMQPAAYGDQPPHGYPMHDAAYGSLGTPLEAGFEHEVAQQGYEHDEAYEDGHDEDYHDNDAQRPRYGLIVASVVAAFVVGGGLTYAYKLFFAPPVNVAGAPLVRNGSDPFKIKPSDPGGTRFSNTDTKVMDQLNGSDGGPKPVQTLTVGRDGTITTGSTNSAPPSPVSAPSSSGGVPGMVLDGGPSQRATAVPPAAAGNALLQAAETQRSAPARVSVASAPPQAAAAPPMAAPAPADDVPPAVSAAPPKKSKKVAVATALPAAAAVVPKAPTGANGYVAVLASMPASGSSRMQAMQQFADLQQKYGDVLGSKAPDVVEAKLDKGTYHRLVVGPPASRDAAKQVCEKLKAAGYTADCWVTAF